MAGIAAFASVAVVSKQIKTRREVTYSVPSTERLLNAKHFSRLPPKSVARQEALWQDTLREGSVRALCQGREYNSSRLTCHLKEAVRARNSIGRSCRGRAQHQLPRHTLRGWGKESWGMRRKDRSRAGQEWTARRRGNRPGQSGVAS